VDGWILEGEHCHPGYSFAKEGSAVFDPLSQAIHFRVKVKVKISQTN